MGCITVLLHALCTAVPQLPEFCRQVLAVVLGSSTERIAIIVAMNRVREKNNSWSNGVQSWRDYLDKMKIILWLTTITFTYLAVFTVYMGIISISLMVQSLQWLTTDCSVRGSNAGVDRGARFSGPIPTGPTSLLQNGYRVSFPRVKQPGRGAHHPSPSSAKVKERAELHIHLPFSACLAFTGTVSLSLLTKSVPQSLTPFSSQNVRVTANKIYTNTYRLTRT